jgi:acyl-CoA synthetase (AMP-forming)/AMP-acid ligase II
MSRHLLSIFEENRSLFPDKPLYVRVAKDGSVSDSVTFGQMSRLIASYSRFIDGRIERGAKVVLLYPSSFEFIPAFLGCLHRGVLPIAFQVPNSRYKLEKMYRLLQKNGVRHILVSRAVMERGWFRNLMAGVEYVSEWDWIIDESEGSDGAYQPFTPHWDENATMYFQLSSGSTGDQKFIPISSANVFHNCMSVGRRTDRLPDDRYLSWLPYYHDLGLVGGLFFPLLFGNTCHLMDPLDFVSNPALWFESVSRFGIGFTFMPNFALDLCTKRVDPGNLPGDTSLSSLRGIFVGAEPIREGTLKDFAAGFESMGFSYDRFLVGYGMAESTLIISVKGIDTPVRSCQPIPGGPSYVTCGPPIDGFEVHIRKQDSDSGPIGEVVVSGPSVSALFEDGVLPTGDLGFMDGGELFVTGRKKELIIINGVKYMLHELEHLAEGLTFVHPQGALACIDETGLREELVLLLEVRRQLLPDADLPGYARIVNNTFNRELGIAVSQTFFYPPASLPKTSSGKKHRGEWRMLLPQRIIQTNALDYGRQSAK